MQYMGVVGNIMGYNCEANKNKFISDNFVLQEIDETNYKIFIHVTCRHGNPDVLS